MFPQDREPTYRHSTGIVKSISSLESQPEKLQSGRVLLASLEEGTQELQLSLGAVHHFCQSDPRYFLLLSQMA